MWGHLDLPRFPSSGAIYRTEIVGEGCATSPCCGIFNSVSGNAPNRIFNIEGRSGVVDDHNSDGGISRCGLYGMIQISVRLHLRHSPAGTAHNCMLRGRTGPGGVLYRRTLLRCLISQGRDSVVYTSGGGPGGATTTPPQPATPTVTQISDTTGDAGCTEKKLTPTATPNSYAGAHPRPGQNEPDARTQDRAVIGRILQGKAASFPDSVSDREYKGTNQIVRVNRNTA